MSQHKKSPSGPDLTAGVPAATLRAEGQLLGHVGENDVLYGSVTSGDVAEFLKGKGIEIDKRKVLLDEPIKHLGEHELKIKLHPEVVATLKLLVTKEG